GVIYVVPANRHVTLSDHHLEIDQKGADRPKPSIDLLFQTAAAVFGEGLVAVVLSGLGSDGATGARRVKEAGGTVIIQNPRSANYPAMPRAIAPTAVDMVADADAMGPLLYDLLTGVYTPAGPGDDRQLRAFLAEVHNRTGIDFNRYKPATIRRRLERRLAATNIRTLGEYREVLERQPQEFDRLVNSFLIKVTEFFRDPELFAYLRTTVIPALVTRARAHGNELRLWSAGCATGEEAYSLAMLVAEALGDELDLFSVRIFATDLDSEAIEFGRRGVYPAAALAEVPRELVARYCMEQDGMCELTKIVRGLVVFGEHDLGQRPPFPRIDLCLCRNVLIYFTAELQQRALELFAFALRDGAYLVLGKAESTGPLPEYYTTADSALKVYRRQGDRMLLPLPHGRSTPTKARREQPAVPSASLELARQRRETFLDQNLHDDAEELLLR
ncbi:MAG: CheR family methyltransferase, partial [Chloroflexota bacterium]